MVAALDVAVEAALAVVLGAALRAVGCTVAVEAAALALPFVLEAALVFGAACDVDFTAAFGAALAGVLLTDTLAARPVELLVAAVALAGAAADAGGFVPLLLPLLLATAAMLASA